MTEQLTSERKRLFYNIRSFTVFESLMRWSVPHNLLTNCLVCNHLPPLIRWLSEGCRPSLIQPSSARTPPVIATITHNVYKPQMPQLSHEGAPLATTPPSIPSPSTTHRTHPSPSLSSTYHTHHPVCFSTYCRRVFMTLNLNPDEYMGRLELCCIVTSLRLLINGLSNIVFSKILYDCINFHVRIY